MDRKVHTQKILELLTFRESDSHLCSVNLKLSEYMQLHMCSIHTNIGNYLRVVNRCMLSIETKDLNKKLVSLAGFNFFFPFFVGQLGAKSENIMQHSQTDSFTPTHLARIECNKYFHNFANSN